MKTKYVIGVMTIVWLVLMMNILWKGTDGKWYVEDAQKIERLEVAKYSNQIMIVSVDAEEAVLCFFMKKKTGEWELLLQTEAWIGAGGLGKKKEGDEKSPVGVFCFTHAFGVLENPGAKLPYVQVNENHYWVDDGESNYYNQFVDKSLVEADWNSAEHLCDFEEAYAYVLATSYNMERISGAGSAVFLHCAKADMESTAGCVAIPEFYMEQIMKVVEAECVLIIDSAENILKY